ncbi:hypothetical protein BAOM_0995 [Peribacillus asahii]|uniref:YjcZ family sporulation protein n=1 Tax=Peribacillus asahii TaxID=228899 RepID=A0A3T0KMI2_9BACI|nr:hypothetical protein BAOM_0995 [Peribacillus asahii]
MRSLNEVERVKYECAYSLNGYLKGGDSMSGGGFGFGGGFALIVVLFILLIIIGASWF